MSVIIPAILRALGVGDPFMQEDTVDPNFSTVEIARVTSTRIELGPLGIHVTVITDSDDPEGTVGAATPRQGDLVSLDAKDDRKHQLTAQASDVSLGDSKMTKIVSFVDESDIADLPTQVRRSITVEKYQGVEVDTGENTRSNGR
jgi:hypothetical protein